ncbi:MAG TPA: N-6 DNA methylase [Candidatus Ratteibacteria bacterium]|nr:N-6 DNA methylase [Candidatus Ratteibacteria bacterium]
MEKKNCAEYKGFISKENKNTGYVRDISTPDYTSVKNRRRDFGAHMTSVDIFKNFIFPEIKDFLYDYAWIDLFAGEGNLILPILDAIQINKRIEFFKEHIFLFDVQKEMVDRSIQNAQRYGIPYEVARTNIQLRDTLQNYPDFKRLKYPCYHITNPPYLYLGYIVKKSERNLGYFSNQNEGYQDLYQVALMNDLRHNLQRLIYIIPTNFLFGFSVSNKIRRDFFSFYEITKAIIFERKIFEFTGTNVCICFFERKNHPSNQEINFYALKVNSKIIKKKYRLSVNDCYRAGGEFNEFISYFRPLEPLKIKFYLTIDEIQKNKGKIPVKLLDVNSFSNGYFRFDTYMVHKDFHDKLKSNPLFVRTLDTGKWEGRCGIYNVQEIFGVDGIVVKKKKYRTHPIQIFITPVLSECDLLLLKDYFNVMLEYFRKITDSEFLTTFKYSSSDYIRKYLGLSQTRKLLETLPVHLISAENKKRLRTFINQKDIEGIKDILSSQNRKTLSALLLKDFISEQLRNN